MQPGRPAGGDKRQTGLNKGLHLTRSESTLILGLPAGATHLHTKVGRCTARTWGHSGGLDLRSPIPLNRCSVTSLVPQPLRGSCSTPSPLSAELTALAPLGATPSVLLPLLCPRLRGKAGAQGSSGDRQALWGGRSGLPISLLSCTGPTPRRWAGRLLDESFKER